MRRVVLIGVVGAALVALAVPTTAAVAAAPAAAPVIQHWYAGVQAGTTTFVPSDGAEVTCKPLLGTKASDAYCNVQFTGKWKATDQPYHGTYYGVAKIHYIDPKNSNYAEWQTSTVVYLIRDASNKLIKTETAAIDSGTGGVFGYPYDLSISYTIEIRNEQDNFLERMSGIGVNQLDANLKPVRTFIDRIGFQNGI